jgi:hypothetical protein
VAYPEGQRGRNLMGPCHRFTRRETRCVRCFPQGTAGGDRRWRERSISLCVSTPRARLPRTRRLSHAPVVIRTLPVVRTTGWACDLGSRNVSELVVGEGWHVATGVGRNAGPLLSRDGRANGEGVRSVSARIDARQIVIHGAGGVWPPAGRGYVHARSPGVTLPARPGRGRCPYQAERAGRAASATRHGGPRVGGAPAGCGAGGTTPCAG